MLEVIGNHGCGRCKTVKRLMEEKGLNFNYRELNSLPKPEQTVILNEAKRAGITALPIVKEDGKIIDFRGVIA